MSAQPEAVAEDIKTNGVPLIKMEKIGRRFGTIVALEEVDFEVGYQEIIGLLGDNGAGKSTLIKVLTGVHPQTSGQIFFEGQPVTMTSPQDARDLGIETVYQDLALVPLMNISRNFYLGREPRKHLGPVEILDKEVMDANTTQALAHIGIKIRGAAEPVGTLSGGERQSIAIGRAVHFGTKLLILDEPTSALSIGETRKVIGYTLEAKKRGISVIFITHNIHHVFEVADRFTVISHGHKVGDFRKDEVTQDEVAGMIMGEPIPARLANRTPPPVNTRPKPIEVHSTAATAEAAASSVGAESAVPAISADGTPVATQKTMTVKQRDETRRRRAITFWAVVVLAYLLVGGAIFYYTRPAAADETGVPALVKDATGQGFSFKLPASWKVDRAESQIRHAQDATGDLAMVITWDSIRDKKISPSAKLSKVAQDIEDNDVTQRKYSPGTDVTVGGRPAYRFEWVNDDPQVMRTGVDYIFIDANPNQPTFYDVTIDGPTAQWETKVKPLADAMMAAFAFN